MGVKKNNPKKQLEAELKKQLNSKPKNQLDYETELKKLKARIKIAEKIGYKFPTNLIPDKPARITKKHIQYLSELKGDKLRSKADSFVGKSTGANGTKSNNKIPSKPKQIDKINFPTTLNAVTSEESEKQPAYDSELKKLTSKIESEYKLELRKLKQRIKRAEEKGFIFPDNIIPDKPEIITQKDIEALSELTRDKLRSKADYFIDKSTGETFTGAEGVKILHYRRSLKAKQANEINQYAKNYNDAMNGKLAPDEADNFVKKFEQLPEETKNKILRKWWEGLSDEEKNIIEQDLENKRKYDRTVPEAEPTDPWDDYSFPPSEVDNVLANIEEQLNRWSPSPNWTPTLAGVKENDKNIVQSMYEGALSEYGREGLAQILQGKASQINSLLGEILYASGDKEGNFKDGNTRVNFDINLFASLLNDKPLSIHQSERLTDLAESMELNN